MDFCHRKSLKARPDFCPLFPPAGHADLHGSGTIKGNAAMSGPTLCFGRHPSLRDVYRQTPYEGGKPYAVMNARLTGDPVAPRTLNPSSTPAV